MEHLEFKFWIAILGVFLLAAVLVGWSDPVEARKTLENAGYTPVSVEGVAWFACGNGDWYSTKFVAKNAQGKTITGTVCSGLLFKGSTVRFD